MDLILDGESRPFDASDCANLAELVSLAGDLDRPAEESVVVAVAIDGERLPPESLADLERHPLDGIRQVAIERRSTRSVACSVLVQGADYCDRIGDSIEESVTAFRAGRVEVGNQVLAVVTDSLTVLTGLTHSVAGVLADAAETLVGLQAALLPWLQELVEAQRATDPLRIADLLEYEIAPHVEEWGRVLRATAEVTDAQGAPTISS